MRPVHPRGTALAALLALGLAAPAAGAEQPTRSVVGAEGGYRTIVDRSTKGELSDAEYRQVSMLGSQIVGHLNAARAAVEVGDAEEARTEIGKAKTLAGIVRDLLPVTTVETVVKSPGGETLYRHRDEVQDDLLPLYSEMTRREVVQPVMDAKQEEAAARGTTLAEAQLVHTSVLLDLGYVERKLARAERFLDEPEAALEALALAQTQGVRLDLKEQDDPLWKAQAALRLAERNVEAEHYEAARRNLTKATAQLEAYRTLVDEADEEKVQALRTKIAELSESVEQPGTLETLRSYWSQVTDWMETRPGETRPTGEASGTT